MGAIGAVVVAEAREEEGEEEWELKLVEVEV